MKHQYLLSALVIVLIFLPSSFGVGYLLWGTQFLYKPYKFAHDPNATTQNRKSFQDQHGLRGTKYIASINQDVVEKNGKLFDIEDSTKSYRSPLSYW